MHCIPLDSGKSTLSGQLLIQTGMVDSRMIDRYEREAKEKNRESWYLAFVMDAAEEERAKGKTIEVGRAKFETERKRYTLLDAPGHKSYVPNMIGGASQADVAILVISARRGEYETGFDRGGQTREHAMLAKTLGVQYLVVAINKMDEPTVQWSQERYNECVEGLRPFLKQSGFDLSAVYFLPVSGFTGHNILNKVSPDVCPWWERGSLIQTLDELPPMSFEQSQPFRMPIIDRYIDRGLMVLGKIEYGRMAIGDRLLVQPGRTQVRVSKIYQDETEVNAAVAGENIRVKLSGADDNTVQRG